MNTRAALRWPERIFLIFGLLLVGLWFKNNSEARAFRSAETKKLEAARLSNAPWCPASLASGVFGRIEIPVGGPQIPNAVFAEAEFAGRIP